jgi:hypothetical protein
MTAKFTHFAFSKMPPTQRAAFVSNLMALYEACLIDVGRCWPEHDFLYPHARPSVGRKRRKARVET